MGASCTCAGGSAISKDLPVSSARPRPPDAEGVFLRILTINDCYKLEHYPRVAYAIAAERKASEELGCVVKAHMNGDFLSPCTLTALDGGKGMMEALCSLGLDYACLGNHEFDLGFPELNKKMVTFNGKLINSNVEDSEFQNFPRFDEFEVGGKSVVVGGYATEDLSDYRPSSRPSITPITEACIRTWNEVKAMKAKPPDLFLPMTHQRMPGDRATAQALSEHPELGRCTPCILGGHDHDVYLEDVGPTKIVKVGEDAVKIGFIDIWWSSDGGLKSSVDLKESQGFSCDPNVSDFVKRMEDFMETAMSVPIAELDRPMSSKRVRFESGESSMAPFLLGLVKRGLQRDGVEVAMTQGGSVRGNMDHEAGMFTMGDLYQEFPFDTSIAIVHVPGRVLAESVKASREKEVPNPFLLHLDPDCKVSSTHELLEVNGAPLNMDKKYALAVYQFLLESDTIEALHSYVKANGGVPTVEACLPAKQIVISICMKDTWKEVLEVGEGEVESKLEAAFKSVDENNDGNLEYEELKHLLNSRKSKRPFQSELASHMIKTLDKNGDGQISREELRMLIH